MSEFLEDLSYKELNKYTKEKLSDRLTELEVEHDISQKKDVLIDLLRAEGGQLDEEPEDEFIQPETYIVIRDFKDLKDKGYVYIKDNKYPRIGNKKVTQDRVDELLGNKNKIGKQLIKERE